MKAHNQFPSLKNLGKYDAKSVKRNIIARGIKIK